VSTAVLATHTPSSSPKPIIGVQWPSTKGATSALMALTASAQRSLRARSPTCAERQRAIGPMPIRNSAGAISGTNTASK
jgi:hypothetical protein